MIGRLQIRHIRRIRPIRVLSMPDLKARQRFVPFCTTGIWVAD
jgi:hypothetical protein